jgi:hypothetical protein
MTDQEIENAIVEGAEGFFALKDDREQLQVAIRITGEFKTFLLKFPDSSPPDETTYVMDTVRSGLDLFWLLARGCSAIRRDYVAWTFEERMPQTYVEFRDCSRHHFEQPEGPDATALQRLSSLLTLLHLELMFMAYHFPLVVTRWD